ncbi:hypothetical protein [Paraburkholderia sp.]|uniref:hypothetical protein n=1 Tax=Paraburkholderia sp. TaxID=1926495 RepID=UPI003D6DABD8
MSSQPASSTLVPAHPARTSFSVTLRRIAREMWRSYQRHSQYQVMLAAGRDHGVPDDEVRGRRR